MPDPSNKSAEELEPFKARRLKVRAFVDFAAINARQEPNLLAAATKQNAEAFKSLENISLFYPITTNGGFTGGEYNATPGVWLTYISSHCH